MQCRTRKESGLSGGADSERDFQKYPTGLVQRHWRIQQPPCFLREHGCLWRGPSRHATIGIAFSLVGLSDMVVFGNGLSGMSFSLMETSRGISHDAPSCGSPGSSYAACNDPVWSSPSQNSPAMFSNHATPGNGLRDRLSAMAFSLVGLSDTVVSIVKLSATGSPSRSSPS